MPDPKTTSGIPLPETLLSAEQQVAEKEKEKKGLGKAKVYAKPKHHGTLGSILKNIFTIGTAYTPKTVAVESIPGEVSTKEPKPSEEAAPRVPSYTQTIDIKSSEKGGEKFHEGPDIKTYAKPGEGMTDNAATLASVVGASATPAPATEAAPSVEFGYYANPMTADPPIAPDANNKWVELRIKDAGGEKRWVQVPKEWGDVSPDKSVSYGDIEQWQN